MIHLTFKEAHSELNPHEQIEKALAACTIQTLELYGGRKGWDVSALEVDVKIVSEGAETLIERHMNFGTMPEDQKKRLLEIASKCPIHKLLTSKITINTYEK